MKAVVLCSLPASHAVTTLLDRELARTGYDAVEHFGLARLQLGFCQGEFDCWLRTPGRCKIHDAAQAIASAAAQSDALFFVGPLSFGGFDSTLKLGIDRLICLISPYFEKRHALTHHQARYARYPRLHAIGLLPSPDAEQTATFEALNDANAVNLFAPARGSAVLTAGQEELWAPSLRRLLLKPVIPGASITTRAAVTDELIAAATPDASSPSSASALRSVGLLVGSAKPLGASASELLARAFMAHFEHHEIECRLHFAREFVHVDTAVAAARSLAGADLFLLSTPLYVDSLPALATRALERVLAVRLELASRGGLFVPFVNCGFPEPEHTRTALRITRHFARAAGYTYAGALPLGGGGVVAPGRSLEEERPPVSHVVRAITLAAPALAAGAPVPEAALRALLDPPLSDAIYRFMGDIGFRVQARRLGTRQRALRAAPFGPPRS